MNYLVDEQTYLHLLILLTDNKFVALNMSSTTARIFVRFGGQWDENGYRYNGGVMRGIFVEKTTTHEELLDRLYNLTGLNREEVVIKMKIVYMFPSPVPPFELMDTHDVQFYVGGEDAFSNPICLSIEDRVRETLSRNKTVEIFPSGDFVSGTYELRNQKKETTRIETEACKLSEDDIVLKSHVYPVMKNTDACRLSDDDNEWGVFSPYRGEDDAEYSYESLNNDIEEREVESPNSKDPELQDDAINTRRVNVDMSKGTCKPTEQVGNISNGNLRDADSGKSTMKESKSSNKLPLTFDSAPSSDDIAEGNIFLSKRDMMKKLSVLAMKQNFEFRVNKSTKTLLYIKCIDESCKWRLRAVVIKGSDIFKISKYVSVHNCSLDVLNHDHRQARSWVIGELVKSKYEGPSRQYTPRDIIQDMQKDYGVNISYEKAYRARESAYVSIRGSHEDSYNLLTRYCEAMVSENNGSVYHIELENNNHFKYFFMSIGACVRGFRSCIRPVIAVDGAFLKGKYRGTLLLSACLDGNNQIYPLAYGIVGRESDASWGWFLEKLKEAIGNVENLVFISDRNTSIIKSIATVFPDAFHGFCIHHISMNLNAKYKNEAVQMLFLVAAKAYRQSDFDEYWNRIKGFDGVDKYLEEIGVERWARAYCSGRRYNVMTTNIVESLNALLRDARELPITALVEHVRAKLQQWFWERRAKSSSWETPLTEYAEGIIRKRQEKSLRMSVKTIERFRFQVVDGDKDGYVDLNAKTCSCRVFDLDQIPCAHALAAARERNINPYSLCSRYYTTECLINAYAEAINPLGHVSEWKSPPNFEPVTILPPKTVARVGRRQKERITSIGEVRASRKCGRCGGVGHNKKTCRNPISYTETRES